MKGVISIGSHYGQEYQGWKALGIQNFLFFEPVAANFKKLIENVGPEHCYNIALGNEKGTKVMYVETTNNGMSCSVLEPLVHITQYPGIEFKTKEIVIIDKLDNIEYDRSLYDYMMIDVQGYELEVLKGAVNSLEFITEIFTEVNREELYKDCAMIGDIDVFLYNKGFTRVNVNWSGGTYGDAIYKR